MCWVSGDYDKVNRRRERTREGQLFYQGVKYSREEKTGYYVSTTGKRKRLHVVMWEQEWGREVPEGCAIHHLDWDKSHNYIDNLICVTWEEHERIHNVVGGEAGKRLGYELVKTRVNGLPPGLAGGLDVSTGCDII